MRLGNDFAREGADLHFSLTRAHFLVDFTSSGSKRTHFAQETQLNPNTMPLECAMRNPSA